MLNGYLFFNHKCSILTLLSWLFAQYVNIIAHIWKRSFMKRHLFPFSHGFLQIACQRAHWIILIYQWVSVINELNSMIFHKHILNHTLFPGSSPVNMQDQKGILSLNEAGTDFQFLMYSLLLLSEVGCVPTHVLCRSHREGLAIYISVLSWQNMANLVLSQKVGVTHSAKIAACMLIN